MVGLCIDGHICELEAKHGVDVATSYLTETAGKSFNNVVAESKRQELAHILHKAKFFICCYTAQLMLVM